MKYLYQYHDGEEWLTVENRVFETAQKAKTAGIEDGFEYVRVIQREAKP